jgi:hypothetical protein
MKIFAFMFICVAVVVKKYFVHCASLPLLFLLLVFFLFSYQYRIPNFISVLRSYRHLSPSFSSLFTFIFTNRRFKNKVKNFSFCAKLWLSSYYVHLEFVPVITKRYNFVSSDYLFSTLQIFLPQA